MFRTAIVCYHEYGTHGTHSKFEFDVEYSFIAD